MNHFMLIIGGLLLCIKLNSCDFLSKSKSNNIKDMKNANYTENTLKDSILKVNKREFLGKPVDSLLHNKILSQYQEYIFIDEKPGLVSYLSLVFSKDINIEICVKEFTYMNPFDIQRNWNFELFKKEKIKEMRVIYKDHCIETVK